MNRQVSKLMSHKLSLGWRSWVAAGAFLLLWLPPSASAQSIAPQYGNTLEYNV